MNFTGRFDSLMADLMEKKQKAVLILNEDAREAFQKLKDYEKLDISIKRHKRKRSLDANAYYWTLLTMYANEKGISKNRAHNEALRRYGQFAILGGQLIRSLVLDTDETWNNALEEESYHIKPTTQVTQLKDGKDYRTYYLLRGSSDYNTQEMACLINGVINDCLDADISESRIMTPDEKRLLKGRYGVNIG
ncbi:hypothetical protein [Dorea sp. D27]|uniref:hypothetical protein n=1 Tax=Dorea sp. D27 TaxID=658665 RepID=UPI00067372CE|nr:hypothetical protein [Dorea sp. D27]